MMMRSKQIVRWLALAVALAVVPQSVRAAGTTPGLVGPGQIVGNYAAGKGLAAPVNWLAAGGACPSWLSPFQLYVNTSGGITDNVLQIFDGAQCVTVGTINGTAHTFSFTAATIPTGTSVVNPGTGVLEMVLPIQTVTGASKVFATADLFKRTRRSNSGTAMTDTFPAASATGMVNGSRIVIGNVDASASITVTAGAGTTMASGGSTDTVGPGRDIAYEYDLAATQWRRGYNTATALLGPNNLSDVSSASTALNNLFGTATAHYFWAGPTSGSAANPTMRAIVVADLPALTALCPQCFVALHRDLGGM